MPFSFLLDPLCRSGPITYCALWLLLFPVSARGGGLRDFPSVKNKTFKVINQKPRSR